MSEEVRVSVDVGCRVTVTRPGFQCDGEVLELAPFSVLIRYVDSTGETRSDWFRVKGRVRHGDCNDDAARFETPAHG